jgi:arylsulfatase A-like enzyme
MLSKPLPRGALAAFALSSLLAACRQPAGESSRIVRLVESRPTVSIAAQAGEPPATLELAAPTVPFAAAEPHARSGARPTDHGYDQRTGFYGTAGGSFRFPVTIGARATLRFSFAAWAPEGDVEPVRFRVTAHERSKATELLSESFEPTPEARWRHLAVPLESLGAGAVELELASEGPTTTWVGWGAPEVSWDAAQRRRRPNLILISLDTLRADRLNSYGYERYTTSPALDAFAARGLRFAWAISQAPWTRPSHRSMFAGRYPSFVEHPDEFLAHRLWRQHYRTVGIAGGGQLDKKFGFGHGFETYQADQWVHKPEKAIELLAERPDRETFLFLHTYEIHDPYTDRRFAESLPSGRAGLYFGHKSRDRIRKDTTQEEKDYISALYDGDLAYTDERLRVLFELFEREGVLDDTIVIITSDHGEEFWEHGTWRHGQNLYDTLLHVPLIVWLPPDLRARFAPAFPAGAAAPAVIDQQVGLIDLVPTVFELLDLEPPAGLQGRSLVPLLRGERLPERPLMAENLYMTAIQKYSLRSDKYKLITPRPDRKVSRRVLDAVEPELFDLRVDRGEITNIAADYSRLVERLQKELERIAQGGELDETSEPATQDEKLRKELEALGYIGN